MTADLYIKSFPALVKGVTPTGGSRIVVATLGTVDRDSDVTLPGWFGHGQTVAVLPAHDWKSPPLGKGRLYEVGDEAVVDVEWNLDVPAARAWLAAVKFDLEHGEPLQQWSYGWSPRKGSTYYGELSGRRVQFLGPAPDGSPGAVVHEISPVLVGSGINTRTLSADPPSDDDAQALARRIAADFDQAANDQAASELARYIALGMEVA